MEHIKTSISLLEMYDKINELVDKINYLEIRVEELQNKMKPMFGVSIIGEGDINWKPCDCAPLVGDGSKECPKCGGLI